MSNTHIENVLNRILEAHPETRDELVAFWSSLSRASLEEYVRVAVLGMGW